MTTSGKGRAIKPAEGKLGILLPGMGAVATTFMAGVEAIRTGLSKPIGSLTQMGTVRLGKRTDNRSPLIKDFVPIARLEDVVFGGWDIYTDNAYVAAKKAGVLENEHLAALQPFLEKIKPWPAATSPAALISRRDWNRASAPTCFSGSSGTRSTSITGETNGNCR